MFMVYAGADEGSSREFVARVDEIRYATSSVGDEAELSTHETFDEGLGTFLVQDGSAGVAAAVGGRLELALVETQIGHSSVGLDSTRFSLPGDFSFSLSYELSEFTASTDGRIHFEVYASADYPPGPHSIKFSCSTASPGTIRAMTQEEDVSHLSTESWQAGRIRIRRSGPEVFLELWEDGWQELLSADVGTPLQVGMAVFSTGAPSPALIAVDDVRIEGIRRRH